MTVECRKIVPKELPVFAPTPRATSWVAPVQETENLAFAAVLIQQEREAYAGLTPESRLALDQERKENFGKFLGFTAFFLVGLFMFFGALLNYHSNPATAAPQAHEAQTVPHYYAPGPLRNNPNVVYYRRGY